MKKKGYCPNCKENVEMKKESFSFLLAFLLAFTGIGLVIYILYWIDLKPKICAICETECELPQLEDNSQSPKQLEMKTPKLITDEKVKFCHNCGTQIEFGENAKFCNYCGDNVV